MQKDNMNKRDETAIKSFSTAKNMLENKDSYMKKITYLKCYTDNVAVGGH